MSVVDQPEMAANEIVVNVPLMIRLLEWAREDSKSDMELHRAVENMIALSIDNSLLEMTAYDDIIDILD